MITTKSPLTSVETLPHVDEDERFCVVRPCPVCGKEVFYGRYNGGTYWVEALDAPWVRHPCMVSSRRKRGLSLRQLYEENRQERWKAIGIVPPAITITGRGAARTHAIVDGARLAMAEIEHSQKHVGRPEFDVDTPVPSSLPSFEVIDLDDHSVRVSFYELRKLGLRQLHVRSKSGHKFFGVTMRSILEHATTRLPAGPTAWVRAEFRKDKPLKIGWDQVIDDPNACVCFVLKQDERWYKAGQVAIIVESPTGRNAGMWPKIERITVGFDRIPKLHR